MLRISRKTLLAIEAVVDIALHARPDPVQSREVTRRQGVPQRYLEQVMQQLVHHGILRGVRGPKGGYILARERRRISLGEIVRIVDGAERPGDDDAISKSPLSTEIVVPLWADLEGELLARLDSITVEKLCEEAQARGLAEPTATSRDFTI